MADEDAFRDTHAIAQNGRGLAPVEGYRRCRVRKSALRFCGRSFLGKRSVTWATEKAAGRAE